MLHGNYMCIYNPNMFDVDRLVLPRRPLSQQITLSRGRIVVASETNRSEWRFTLCTTFWTLLLGLP